MMGGIAAGLILVNKKYDIALHMLEKDIFSIYEALVFEYGDRIIATEQTYQIFNTMFHLIIQGILTSTNDLCLVNLSNQKPEIDTIQIQCEESGLFCRFLNNDEKLEKYTIAWDVLSLPNKMKTNQSILKNQSTLIRNIFNELKKEKKFQTQSGILNEFINNFKKLIADNHWQSLNFTNIKNPKNFTTLGNLKNQAHVFSLIKNNLFKNLEYWMKQIYKFIQDLNDASQIRLMFSNLINPIIMSGLKQIGFLYSVKDIVIFSTYIDDQKLCELIIFEVKKYLPKINIGKILKK